MELADLTTHARSYTKVLAPLSSVVALPATFLAFVCWIPATTKSGGRKRKEQSTLVTQSSGQAPLETQHFGRTTALQNGPGKIRATDLCRI